MLRSQKKITNGADLGYQAVLWRAGDASHGIAGGRGYVDTVNTHQLSDYFGRKKPRWSVSTHFISLGGRLL